MKKLFFSFIIGATGLSLHAQEITPDQNPNYKVSMEKYKAMQNDLQTSMNTTVQNTYKAYDWTTAKAERKIERRNERREYRLFNNYNRQYYDPYNYNGRNSYGRPYQYRNYNGWRW